MKEIFHCTYIYTRRSVVKTTKYFYIFEMHIRRHLFLIIRGIFILHLRSHSFFYKKKCVYEYAPPKNPFFKLKKWLQNADRVEYESKSKWMRHLKDHHLRRGVSYLRRLALVRLVRRRSKRLSRRRYLRFTLSTTRMFMMMLMTHRREASREGLLTHPSWFSVMTMPLGVFKLARFFFFALSNLIILITNNSNEFIRFN